MLRVLAVSLAFTLAFTSVALATTGCDVSQTVSTSAWKCLQSPGGQGPIELAIPRLYRSSGAVDSKGVASVKAAHAAGVPHVDGYLFPCVSCGNAAGQVTATLQALSAAGASISTLWLDIERYKWSTNTADNQAFIKVRD